LNHKEREKMKKLIVLFILVMALSIGACRNVSPLTRLPSDTANYTFDKVDGEAVMTQRKSGEDVVLTKREVNQLNKDSSDVVDFRADLIFQLRKTP